MADDAAFTPPDPTDVASGFSVILHYDPLMVAELALGADHPYEIADRYGVDPDAYEHLAAQSWFTALVAQKRHEFHDGGVLFQAKAGMMAEALLTRLFQQSMAGTVGAALSIEVAKQLTDIGRLKPQPLNTQPGTGGASPFQINIQVNGADVVASKAHLMAAPQSSPASTPAAPDPPKDAPASMTVDFSKAGPAPAHISGLRVRDFDLRPDGTSGHRPNGPPNPATHGLLGVVTPALPRTPNLG